MAGIHQPQGLRGIRLAEPARRHERLADVCHHTGGSRGGASVSHASHDYKVANCDIKVRTASSCLAMPLYPRKQTLIAVVRMSPPRAMERTSFAIRSTCRRVRAGDLAWKPSTGLAKPIAVVTICRHYQ